VASGNLMPSHLEQALDLAFPDLPPSCTACGAPNASLGGVLILRPWDLIVACPACGRAVTESGVSLVPVDRHRSLAIIRLSRDPTSGQWPSPDEE